MAAKASIKLGITDLLYQQTTLCEVELDNADRAFLRNVNPQNHAAGPTILLTDTATGTVTRFAGAMNPGLPPRPVHLPGGQKLQLEFALTTLVRFPGPGSYELRASYTWDGGEAESLPVTAQIRPSRPQFAHIVSASGVVSPIYLGSWLNASDLAKGSFEVWMTSFSAIMKPTVSQCTLIQDSLTRRVDPYLSVPPCTAPTAQWVAWVDRKKLVFAAHRSEEVLAPQSVRLDEEQCRIVPPLCLNPANRRERIPCADVLLYERGPDATEGVFTGLRLEGSGATPLGPPLTVPGSAPCWMETAYLSTAQRFTFFVVSTGGESELRMATWSDKEPPRQPAKVLAKFPGTCIGGALCIAPGDIVRGAIVCETGAGKNLKYTFHKWDFEAADAFLVSALVPISFAGKNAFRTAQVSVHGTGAPYALLRSDVQGEPWMFATPDGRLQQLPARAIDLDGPVCVLFRRLADPTIMYTEPDRGFHFAKPG